MFFLYFSQNHDILINHIDQEKGFNSHFQVLLDQWQIFSLFQTNSFFYSMYLMFMGIENFCLFILTIQIVIHERKQFEVKNFSKLLTICSINQLYYSYIQGYDSHLVIYHLNDKFIFILVLQVDYSFIHVRNYLNKLGQQCHLLWWLYYDQQFYYLFTSYFYLWKTAQQIYYLMFVIFIISLLKMNLIFVRYMNLIKSMVIIYFFENYNKIILIRLRVTTNYQSLAYLNCVKQNKLQSIYPYQSFSYFLIMNYIIIIQQIYISQTKFRQQFEFNKISFLLQQLQFLFQKFMINNNNKLQLAGFISKLNEILQDQSYSHIIEWIQPELIIKNKLVFIENVLPQNFRHKRMQSFVRQLNLYGFRKVLKSNENIIVFRHQNFKRGNIQQLKKIQLKHKIEKQVIKIEEESTIEQTTEKIRLNLEEKKTLFKNTISQISSRIKRFVKQNPQIQNQIKYSLFLLKNCTAKEENLGFMLSTNNFIPKEQSQQPLINHATILNFDTRFSI